MVAQNHTIMNPFFKEALEKGIVEPAKIGEEPFVVDEVRFYQFAKGGTTMSAGRFYAMADINRDYDELKLDGETLDSAIKVIDEAMTKVIALSGQNKEIQEAAMLAKLHVINLQQRRKFNANIDRTYDNATAWYFSDDEDPARYDVEKARRNKTIWAKDSRLLDFFFATPMSQYVDWQLLFDLDGLNSLKATLKLELSILEQTLDSGKRLDLTSNTVSILQSRKETLIGLIGSLERRLKNILHTSELGTKKNDSENSIELKPQN